VAIPGNDEFWAIWLKLCEVSVDNYRKNHSEDGLELDDLWQGGWDAHVALAADPQAAAVAITCLLHIAAGYTKH